MEYRQERVHVETDRHVIEGDLMLPSEGYRSRISDFINARDRDFLVLTDAEVQPIGGAEPSQKHEFVALSIRHVVLLW